MLTKIICIVVTVAASLSILTTNLWAQNCKVDRFKLRSMYVEGYDFPTGLQDVVWGPFKDGSSIRIQYEYLATGNGTHFVENSSPKCVQIDRIEAARTGVMIDAFFECKQLGLCHELITYTDKVFRADGRKLPFIEDGNKNAEQKMENWCLGKQHAKNFLERMPGAIIGIQTHEFAHAMLHEGKKVGIQEEAEADGFSAYITETAEVESNGIRQSSSSFLISQFVTAERNYEISGASHPPSECRIEAALLGLKEWYEKYPSFSAPRTFSSVKIEPFIANAMKEFLPKNDKLCENYLAAFDGGVHKAHQYVNQQTAIKFLFDGSGDRCTVNGGTRR